MKRITNNFFFPEQNGNFREKFEEIRTAIRLEKEKAEQKKKTEDLQKENPPSNSTSLPSLSSSSLTSSDVTIGSAVSNPVNVTNNSEKILTSGKEIHHQELQELFANPIPELTNLPKYYSQRQFQNDCMQLFTFKNGKKVKHELMPLHEQLIPPLSMNEISQNKKLGDLDMIDAENILDFYEKLPRTPFFQNLQEAVHDDPIRCAFVLISLLTAEQKNNPNMTLETLLEKFLKKTKKGLFLIPQMIQTGGNGNQGGHFDVQNLARTLRVQEILERISFKYQHMAEKYQKKTITPFPTDDIEPRQIRSYDEPIFSAELILPDDLFDAKVVLRELHTYQHYKYEPLAKSYVMLLDVSGSMESAERLEYACASAISLIENTLKSLNKGYLILFDSQPHDPLEFKTVGDAIHFLLSVPFTGGGTSIDRALEKADELHPDEVILITDGYDNVHYTPKTPLYTVFCDQNQTNAALCRISTRFEQYQRIKS